LSIGIKAYKIICMEINTLDVSDFKIWQIVFNISLSNMATNH
jgi:hypothetical protein